jgi:membrane-bound metal-dependent hydrolase YbcI (DUF457 family)
MYRWSWRAIRGCAYGVMVVTRSQLDCGVRAHPASSIRMPSSVAHGLTAVALGAGFYPAERLRLYAAAAGGAVLLDVDAIGRPFGLGDVSWLGGHRALTHSLPFAAALAAAGVVAMCRGPDWQGRRLGAWAYFALAFALHGTLDALTPYGDGVMFLAPFSAWRFKAPWQPFDRIIPEVIGVWVPALVIIWYRRRGPTVDFRPQAP